jgi:hypothetical protein
MGPAIQAHRRGPFVLQLCLHLPHQRLVENGSALVAVQALEVGHQVDKLPDGEAVTIIWHERSPVGRCGTRSLHDNGIGAQERLQQVGSGMARADACEVRPRPGRAGLESSSVHRMARIARHGHEYLSTARWVPPRQVKGPIR